MMAQIFGKVGLLLVPFGAVWVASRYWSQSSRKQLVFAIAALIASSVVWAIVSLSAFLFGGPSLGVAAVALGIYALPKVTPRLRSLKHSTSAPVASVALYLLIVPVAVFLIQMTLVPYAAEFSRSRAIRNSEQLIADIEQYRAVHDRYPPSLLAVWNDYWPSVMGIKEFRYEPSGDAYNLLFEQLNFQLGTMEFVVYNPHDRQVMTSHAMDLLEVTGEQLERRRGYYAVHDTRHPHWKYFWFD
jgi:hypothetical protein